MVDCGWAVLPIQKQTDKQKTQRGTTLFRILRNEVQGLPYMEVIWQSVPTELFLCFINWNAGCSIPTALLTSCLFICISAVSSRIAGLTWTCQLGKWMSFSLWQEEVLLLIVSFTSGCSFLQLGLRKSDEPWAWVSIPRTAPDCASQCCSTRA